MADLPHGGEEHPEENLLTSLSAADAKQQLASSFDDLAASFRTAFAPVDCS